MKKVLLTGFEPFLQFPKNPTEEVVKALDGKGIGNYMVVSRVLPVTFQQAGDLLLQLIEDEKPDAIVLLGLAAGRSKITPERIAINVKDGEKDNNGIAFEDDPIEMNGEDGYFSTLPIRDMVRSLKAAGYPAEVSNSAGTYVCNYIMYNALHHLDRQIPAGFIHIPASHELAILHGKVPSWSQQDLNKAVEICIECL
ncbi:pyroglutamyl-peptidase I [Lysinibacillus sp. 54212]|uniref:pyroglutamyl-peptidase I n=1 Tax=Lysinibacillus sp. 54212 TaxID=3119829 RepID=UPI002FCB6F44